MVAETRYPGYDVLDKRDTELWNEKTREVVAARLALPREPQFFEAAEFAALEAVAARIVPQPASHDGNGEAIPVAVLVDNKLHEDIRDGWRPAGLPPQREAWKRGLRALDAEARGAHGGASFASLGGEQQDALLKAMQSGALARPGVGGDAAQAVLQAPPAARRGACLLLAPDSVERDRLRRSRQPTRLRALAA